MPTTSPKLQLEQHSRGYIDLFVALNSMASSVLRHLHSLKIYDGKHRQFLIQCLGGRRAEDDYGKQDFEVANENAGYSEWSKWKPMRMREYLLANERRG